MKIDYILTADWHLREDTPLCRTDDFQAAQWSKVEQVVRLSLDYEAPIICAGDMFHHWKPSPWLLSKTIATVQNMYLVYGQHDLPNHNMELQEKSGIFTLKQADKISLVHGGSWGEEPGTVVTINGRKLGAWHKFVWDGKKLPWPDCDEMTAKQVLRKYKEFALMVTGDHHKPFVERHKGRLLVNPGPLTRQTSAMVDYDCKLNLINLLYNRGTFAF